MTRRLLNRKECNIHDLLVQMSDAAIKAIEDSLQCFRTQDKKLAQNIIAGDSAINNLQHQVEEECITTIALHQPVASDLRDLMSDTYIAIELERIADHAADVARIVQKMSEAPHPEFIDPIDSLGQKTRHMLARAIESYDACNEQQARQIAKEDDEVDKIEQAVIDNILEYMRKGSGDTTSCTQVLWIVHNLERIGDRVTNIAERVVFMATGETVDLNQ